MKKILVLLFLSILSFASGISAQVKVNQNAANSAINTSSAFMDASSSPLWNGTTNQGKGMLYPRVDLVAFNSMSHAGPFNASNNPNYFDGLLVFNTATGVAGIGADSVFPGYYYYRNTTTTANGGHWVSLKGIKGDDGAIGPIGPQGVQGVDGAVGATGPIGATGAMGLQGTTGATGAQGLIGLTGATGATGATGTAASFASTTSGMRFGFSSSTTWTCPTGVYSVKVEIWGAAGGGGGCYINPGPIYYRGGDGGKGGYNMAVVSVIPGTVYSISIGVGGSGGLGGPITTGVSPTPGGAGGASNFNSSISASGGGGGSTGSPSSPYFVNGSNGSVLNYNYPAMPSSRTFIDYGYIQPGPSASGGGGGQGYGSPVNGSLGENGFCIISY